jgi:5-methylthioadenosine/S-adenosylhomocysteine deaminase
MVGEMGTAALLHKAYRNDPTALSARTVLEMATIRAARVVGWDDEIGSLEVGKAADFVIVDLNQPHLVPLYNPYSHIAYSMGRTDVETVVINGRIVMRERKLLTIDEEAVKRSVRELGAEISSSSPQPSPPGGEGETVPSLLNGRGRG